MGKRLRDKGCRGESCSHSIGVVDSVLHEPSQLIDDKKVLSERCEQLVKEMKAMDSKYKNKIKTMEERWVEPS